MRVWEYYLLIVRDIPLSRRHNQGREGGSHKDAWKGRRLPSKQSEAKAALFSMYSHAKHRQLLIKAGQVGYLPASQLPCPSLLLSELRYPRVAANLKR